jgi:hypothetical protein
MFVTSRMVETAPGVVTMHGPPSVIEGFDLRIMVDVGVTPRTVADRLVKILQDAGVEHFSVCGVGQQDRFAEGVRFHRQEGMVDAATSGVASKSLGECVYVVDGDDDVSLGEIERELADHADAIGANVAAGPPLLIPDAAARPQFVTPVPYAVEVSVDGQTVRYEAPTAEEVMRLMRMKLADSTAAGGTVAGEVCGRGPGRVA